MGFDRLARKTEEARAYFEKGLRFHLKGEYRAAAIEFHLVVALVPEFVGGWVALGETLMALRKYDDAASAFESACVLGHSEGGCHAQLARCYVRAGRLDEALGSFRLAAVYEPGICEYQVELAAAFLRLGSRRDALGILVRAAERFPRAVAVYFHLGVVCELMGLLDRALESYRRACQLEGAPVRAFYSLGLLYERMGQYSKAAECLRDALLIDAGDIDVRQALCRVLVALGDSEGARREVEFVYSLRGDLLSSSSGMEYYGA